MNKFLFFVILAGLAFVSPIRVFAQNCGSSFIQNGDDIYSSGCADPYYQTKNWTLSWAGGVSGGIAVRGVGRCIGGYFFNTYCYPHFRPAGWTHNTETYSRWNQEVWTGRYDGANCYNSSVYYENHFYERSCVQGPVGGCNGSANFTLYPTSGCASGFVNNNGICGRSLGFMSQCLQFGDYDEESCACTGGCAPFCSPIVIDVEGDGFSLTSAANGVSFDLDKDGIPEVLGWTSVGSDDAWLVLDRNSDGLINNGRELFGNVTPQEPPPPGTEMNGFRALAIYDGSGYGGNRDGVISDEDAVFERLRLWQDVDHNGVSEATELFTLPDVGLRVIDLDYKRSRRVDLFGNQFKYRAKVRDSNGAQLGRWAWDVWLVTAP